MHGKRVGTHEKLLKLKKRPSLKIQISQYAWMSPLYKGSSAGTTVFTRPVDCSWEKNLSAPSCNILPLLVLRSLTRMYRRVLRGMEGMRLPRMPPSSVPGFKRSPRPSAGTRRHISDRQQRILGNVLPYVLRIQVRRPRKSRRTIDKYRARIRIRG